jgi:hypothetical protein
LKEDKVQLKVYLTETLIEKFRTLVALKHQRCKRGLLSYEVEQALKQYIASYNTQQQYTQKALLRQEQRFCKSNTQPKLYALKQDIIKYLVDSEQYVDEPQNITDRHLSDAIGAVRGTDPRTVKKWIKLLEQFGYIKWSGVHQIEFL